MDETKACRMCGEIKLLLDFPLRRDQPDGHHWWCFDCKREKSREYQGTYRARHPEEVRRASRNYERKDEVQDERARQSLLKKYGLTPEAFGAKLAAQGGACPFCPPGDASPKEWHVDHDHDHCPGQATCGACLRDILCRRHNMGLGYFDDDPAQLRAAADYIEQWRSRIAASGAEPWQPKGVPSGERHSAWKGDDASPKALRKRTYTALGSADRCVNGCERDYYEWVLTRGADAADPASYQQMCRSCSTTYYGLQGAGHPNAKLTMAQAAEIRTRYVPGQRPNQTDLAREYGVSQGVISSVVRGEKYLPCPKPPT
jgi:hypothetical protein